MVKIVFCLPGKDYSREFLLSWSDLIMQAGAKGHNIMISQQYSSVVHFARAKCMGGDALKGPDQKPFQGAVDYDVMMWIDSDMVFKPEDFFKLLESPHDVTAGLYMMENMTDPAHVPQSHHGFAVRMARARTGAAWRLQMRAQRNADTRRQCIVTTGTRALRNSELTCRAPNCPTRRATATPTRRCPWSCSSR